MDLVRKEGLQKKNLVFLYFYAFYTLKFTYYLAGPVMSRNRAVISQSLQRFGQTTTGPQRVRARPLAMQNANLIAQFATSQK